MANEFQSQRRKATASTLRDAISDTSPADREGLFKSQREAIEKRQNGTSNLLILSAPIVEQKEDAHFVDNAFAEPEHIAKSYAANSAAEPEVTNSKLLQLAQNAINKQIDEIAPEKIQSMVEEITPLRLANIFAEHGEVNVSKAVKAFAPSAINELAAQITPRIVEQSVNGAVRLSVDKAVKESVGVAVKEGIDHEIEQRFPGGFEKNVSKVVNSEMQGAFGFAVTKKIRKMIREEIRELLKD